MPTTRSSVRTIKTEKIQQPSPVKKEKKKFKKKVATNDSFTINKKITDYFQIRKSNRKCKSNLEREKTKEIEQAIVNNQEDGLIVKYTNDKGRAVFATKTFHKGDFVVEYAGELISYQEASERELIYSEKSLGCYMYYFIYKNKTYCIDATAESGRLGRLLNHSKTNSNCHTKLFEINSQPALAILASKDIKIGEELLYDYGDRSKSSLKAHPWLLD